MLLAVLVPSPIPVPTTVGAVKEAAGVVDGVEVRVLPPPPPPPPPPVVVLLPPPAATEPPTVLPPVLAGEPPPELLAGGSWLTVGGDPGW